MHELSLACSVVELVDNELHRHGGGALRTVEVTVGDLSGVDCEAFAYSLQMILDRRYAGVRVALTRVSPRARCLTCGGMFEPASIYTPCPHCGSYSTQLLEGQEFRLSSLTVEADEDKP
ncbi:hydrogenase maturation nickel metallochaperone HypA [Barnesiella sp. An55]|uniref:hydrogenase maturation nickel metallochaperone HypA/HybF n=1 Tax=Barnesiella sp. An55 TaxID=1965646 RepID=UPI000B375F54|nr:hydrogenase maturation nickel metallochaperone HypA [Barnesiella sp. An55]OUN70860.1 hypothetical protein B5G10_10035 [Barnesiella sp. An55]